ncbi:hypothetical protein HYX18_04195 [Candidatus Woesearchaeota archaeon]|nr:hypothetical protein [Candidatus Woesearchaeota archaeon]
MIKQEYKEQIGSLNEYVALALVSAKNYQEINLEFIKTLVNDQKTPGVYVTLNKPYKTLKALFEKRDIDISLIIFIDSITPQEEIKKTKDCLFIGSPEKLSDISIAMDQAVRAIPSGLKFVFFDSLSTLLIYHNVAVIAKFIHFLSTKMREWSVKGIIISLESDSNKELITQLSQFCDLTFEIR